MNIIEEIKKKLTVRKLELEQALSLLYKETVFDDAAKDTGDQALESSLEDIKISLHNNELNEYNMIVNALNRIEAGNYGFCVECNNPISEKRLMLFPNATRCLVCQEAAEAGR